MMPANIEESLPSKTPAETISRWEMLRILTKARERNSHPDEEPAADKLPALDGLDLDGPVDASTIEKLNVALHALAQEQQIQQDSSMSEPRKQTDAPSKLRSLMLPLAVAQAEHNDAVHLAPGYLDPDMLFVEPAALKRSASAPSARRGRLKSGHGIASTSKLGRSETPDRESQITDTAARRDLRELDGGRDHVKTGSPMNTPIQQRPQSSVSKSAREHRDSPLKAKTGHFQGPFATNRTSPSSSAGARNIAPEGMGGDERQSQHERAIEGFSQQSLPRGGNKAFDSIQKPTQRPIEDIRQERMTPATRQPSENSSQGAGTDRPPGAVRRQGPDPLKKRLSGGKSQDRPVRDTHEKGNTDQIPPLQGPRTPASHGTQDLPGHAAPRSSDRLPSASNPPFDHPRVAKGQLRRHQDLPPMPLPRQAQSKPTERPPVVGSHMSAANRHAPEGSGGSENQHLATATGMFSAPTGSRTNSKLGGSSDSQMRHLQTANPSQATMIPAQRPLPAQQAAPLPSNSAQRPTAPSLKPGKDLRAVHEVPSRPNPQQKTALSNPRSEQTSFGPPSPAVGRVEPGSTARPTEGNHRNADLARPRSNNAVATPLRDPQHPGPATGNQPLSVGARQPKVRTAATISPTAPEYPQRMPQANSVTGTHPSAVPSPNKQATHSPPRTPKDSSTLSVHGTTDAREEQGDENIEASLPSTSMELVDGDFTADEMFELFLTGRFPRDLSSQTNSISILQLMMRGALYSAQGWLGKETRKASVAIAEGFGLL
ncbi:hypothetical protein KC319_g4023 [Hortaea werneckii]|nr:hypothetical protein KC352_g10317 [Hortaea werneckii]KAI7561715.1 hypothetical protein KC317_g8897 [Hortaea werneckii]KAI7610537.1 hypothetical protein KC346_g8692 [Hortaea werneckii]KAI7677200.1 hypothetical protein KC319_g4023 [Hortaea werneckii]KAI7699712.1 hypothetical protein KC322_g8638 [Hortaea werneckii]